jgi:hypothetical protein
MPVQGGGFVTGVTINYNADASLLRGGENVPIEPVQGGGANKPVEQRLATINEINNNNNNNESTSSNRGPSASNIDELDVNVNDLVEENINVNNNDNNDNDTTVSNSDEEAKPLEVPCPVSKDKEIDELADSFEANEDAVDSKTKETIRLASREFFIRQPKRKSAGETKGDDVMSDWKEQTFTSDEAEFLNTLGFSPKLIYSSFSCHQKDWTNELAEFLYHLSVNSCYPASSLLLKGECQRVREFLMIVESNLKAEQLRKLAEKPVPVAGPITLSELDDDNEEDNKNDTNDEVENKSHASNDNDHLLISERLQKLELDEPPTVETKSIAKKITNFFKSMKPSFLKSKEEKLYNSVLDEIFKLEKDGKLNSNQKDLHVSKANLTLELNSPENEEIDEEEMKRQFDEKIKQLKIKKFMESLPEKYRNIDLSVFIQRMVDKK